MKLQDLTFKKHSEKEVYFIECPDPIFPQHKIVLAITENGSINKKLALEFIDLLKNLSADKNQEKVKFLVHPDAPEEVFAYFPEFKADEQGNMTSYAHIGQHSACAPTYALECRNATKNEYKALHNELISQGYNNIIVVV